MAESPVSVREADSVAIVEFRERATLDTPTVEAVSGELYRLVEQKQQRAIVLDLTNVHFVSSPALSMLLHLRRRADEQHCEVVLCGLRPDISRLFRITKLDKLFVFVPTAADALARFAPPQAG